jgi:PIN domain nuclease of toxin-antitoxin system
MHPKRVAIDTSVFMDYLNPEKNTNDHIDTLLSVLAKRQYRLCVDADKRIEGEYEAQLRPILRNMDETKGFQRYVLQFWLESNPKERLPLDMGDELMTQIKKIIHERKESVDRIFVYAAITADTRLVTNDGKHIIERRKELKKLAKKRDADNVNFMISEAAAADLANWE